MKIIYPGEKPESKVYRFACSYCNCMFECEKRETTPKSGGRNDDYRVAQCPTCGKEVWVEDK